MKSILCALKYERTMNIDMANKEWTGCSPRESETNCDVIQSATFQWTNCFFSQHSKGCCSSQGCSWWQWQQSEYKPGWHTQFHLWGHKTCPDHEILTPQTHEIRGPCLGYWWPNQGNWGHAIVFCLWAIHRGKFSINNSLFLQILYTWWTLSSNQYHMWSLLPVNYWSRDKIKITVSAFGEILNWRNSASGSWGQGLCSGMPRAFELRPSE